MYLYLYHSSRLRHLHQSNLAVLVLSFSFADLLVLVFGLRPNLLFSLALPRRPCQHLILLSSLSATRLCWKRYHADLSQLAETMHIIPLPYLLALLSAHQ